MLNSIDIKLWILKMLNKLIQILEIEESEKNTLEKNIQYLAKFYLEIRWPKK